MTDEPESNDDVIDGDLESQLSKNETADAPKRGRRPAVNRPYPRHELEEALAVPRALKDHNGGNAWPPPEVAGAISVGPRSNKFYYITAAAETLD